MIFNHKINNSKLRSISKLFQKQRFDFFCSHKKGNGKGFINIRSKKTEVGDSITITYAETKGTEGNILEIEKINTVQDIYGTIKTVYVTNVNEISDASDIETLESIQKNAPAKFQTGYRAGSTEDWQVILEDHPQIYKAKTWTAYDLNQSSVTSEQNVVNIAAISSDGNNLTTEQQADISVNYLKRKKSLTDVLRWKNAGILNIGFEINAIVNKVSLVDLKQEIKILLSNNYDILNRDFKELPHERALTPICRKKWLLDTIS
jgi:hypothetical protein